MLLLVALIAARAAMAADATANTTQRVPPPGIRISPDNRAELEAGVVALGKEIASLRSDPRVKVPEQALLAGLTMDLLLADVEIFHKAVAWPLRFDEFYRSNEVAIARGLLQQGMERARQVRWGKAPWLTATGLVVRGFVSRIDGSIQPCGLVIPANFSTDRLKDFRIDVWLHGRDNHLTELKFIADRQKSAGEFAPANAIVLHPYGRYCNAFKFAGETDVIEALGEFRNAQGFSSLPVTVRGFSMGGAGAWHLAAHRPDLWKAAAPGAGFAETAEYTGALRKESRPPWFEQKLWHLYDATDYAGNFFNLPVLAYSGELDKQKQAADAMSRAMKAEGLDLIHLIGPGVAHKYEPRTKVELARKFEELVVERVRTFPRQDRLTTWTLRYNQSAWLRIDGMDKHWERARIDGELDEARTVRVKTENVSGFSLLLWRNRLLPEASTPTNAVINGQRVEIPAGQRLFEGVASFVRENGNWRNGVTPDTSTRKRHGLQGPIDDAFMDSFVMVRPTGKPLNEKIGAWTAAELARATNDWRAQFRGDARVWEDVALTDTMMEWNNLVLWGDPSSNKLLARIADKLPIRWDRDGIIVGQEKFSAAHHAPVFICPNPLNPRRYVVLNSGFTFAGAGSGSNAQQTPKLPDYAVFDFNAPPAARVAAAGFFDECWQVPSKPD